MKELEAPSELFQERPQNVKHKSGKGSGGVNNGGLWRASVAMPKEKSLAKKTQAHSSLESKGVSAKLYTVEKESASSKRARSKGRSRSQGAWHPFHQLP